VPRTYVLCTEDNIIPPAKQREMAARLGVEPIEIASDHAVFALQPRELAAVLAARADPREPPGFGSSHTARGALPNTRIEPTRAGS
jgi:hypothetical protein